MRDADNSSRLMYCKQKERVHDSVYRNLPTPEQASPVKASIISTDASFYSGRLLVK